MKYIFTAAAMAVAALFLYLNNNIFSYSEYTVYSEKITDDIRLMLISDVHSKDISKELSKAVEKYSPDAILCAGDLWDRHSSHPFEDISILAKAADKVPVYYVPGNHDYGFDERERLLSALSGSGVRVMRAEGTEFGEIELIGLDRLGFADFTDRLLKKETDRFRVLLTHFPQYFEDEYAGKADLVLAGHAHGGQVRIPFLNQGLYAPDQGVFPKYAEGRKSFNGSDIIISRGIGNTSRFPFRIFNLPEIVMIDLKKDTQ